MGEQMNGFDAGFDDTFGDGFGFGNNDDLDIAQENAQTDNNANAFGGDWNTTFGDEDNVFASDNNQQQQPQQEAVQTEEDVDHLFAASAADDLFGGGTDTKDNAQMNGHTDTNGDDLFANTFDDDDVFGNNAEEVKFEEDKNTKDKVDVD